MNPVLTVITLIFAATLALALLCLCLSLAKDFSAQLKKNETFPRILLIVMSLILGVSYFADARKAAKKDVWIPAIQGGYMSPTQAFVISFAFGLLGLVTLWGLIKKWK